MCYKCLNTYIRAPNFWILNSFVQEKESQSQKQQQQTHQTMKHLLNAYWM